MREFKKHIWKALPVLGVLLMLGVPGAKAIGPLVIGAIVVIATGLADHFFLGDKLLEGFLGDIGEGLVAGVAYIINFLVGILGKIFFWVANTTIGFAMDLNALISGSPVVKEGFDVSLSIANLGLLVGFVVIAIAVILKADWLADVRNTIPKFVAAALLINFGFFVLTQWLIKPVDEIFKNIYNAAELGFDTFSGTFSPRLDMEPLVGAQGLLAKIPADN